MWILSDLHTDGWSGVVWRLEVLHSMTIYSSLKRPKEWRTNEGRAPNENSKERRLKKTTPRKDAQRKQQGRERRPKKTTARKDAQRKEGKDVPRNSKEGKDVPRNSKEGKDVPRNSKEGKDVPRNSKEGKEVPRNSKEGKDVPRQGRERCSKTQQGGERRSKKQRGRERCSKTLHRKTVNSCLAGFSRSRATFRKPFFNDWSTLCSWAASIVWLWVVALDTQILITDLGVPHCD